MRGRNDIRFISRANQIVNHELAAITLMVLVISINLNSIVLGLGIGIRIWFSYIGYEPISFYFSLFFPGGGVTVGVFCTRDFDFRGAEGFVP